MQQVPLTPILQSFPLMSVSSSSFGGNVSNHNGRKIYVYIYIYMFFFINRSNGSSGDSQVFQAQGLEANKSRFI